MWACSEARWKVTMYLVLGLFVPNKLPYGFYGCFFISASASLVPIWSIQPTKIIIMAIERIPDLVNLLWIKRFTFTSVLGRCFACLMIDDNLDWMSFCFGRMASFNCYAIRFNGPLGLIYFGPRKERSGWWCLNLNLPKWQQIFLCKVTFQKFSFHHFWIKQFA